MRYVILEFCYVACCGDGVLSWFVYVLAFIASMDSLMRFHGHCCSYLVQACSLFFVVRISAEHSKSFALCWSLSVVDRHCHDNILLTNGFTLLSCTHSVLTSPWSTMMLQAGMPNFPFA